MSPFHWEEISQDLIEKLKNKWSEQFAKIKSELKLRVIYTFDPKEDGQVFRESIHTRPYKSYKEAASNIAQALRENGYRDVDIQPDFLYLKDLINEQDDSDLIWLNTGGVQGLDPMSHTVGTLEEFGVPYIGHSPAGYLVSDNKVISSKLMEATGVPVPEYIHFDFINSPYEPQAIKDFLGHLLSEKSTNEVVLKPVNGRGSVAVYTFSSHNLDDILSQAKEIYETYFSVKIDEFLPGNEYTVTVCRDGDLTYCFPPLQREIDPESKIFLSLDKVPVENRAAPIGHDHPQYTQIMETAAAAYKCLGLTSLCRVDMRAGIDGQLKIIDVNPKPDLVHSAEKTCLTAIAAKSVGIEYEQVLDFIVLSTVDYKTASSKTFRQLF